MRSCLASTLIVSCSFWLATACAPATPPAQEPIPSRAGSSSSDLPSNLAGSSNVGGSANDTSSVPDVGGAGNVHEKMCGGIAGLRCPEKQYCAYAPEAHCGAADMSGTCAKVPDMCAQVVDEVCGCDDKTYSNACMAAQAGVSIVGKGPCAPATTAEGGLCGTRGAAHDCAAGLYCALKSDCGATDAGGTCSKRPTMCTKIYKPVCGCDGKTYGSACTAAADGVSVAHDGACKK